MNDLNHTPPHYWDLLGRYLSGEISGEQKRELERWVQARPEHRAQFEAAVKAWQLAGAADKAYEPDVAAGWAKFSRNLQPAQEAKVIRMQPEPKRRQYLWQAAAAVLVLGLLALVAWLFAARQQPSELIRVVALHETQELYLPDSSRIFLNRNSEITYPADFAAGNRVVNLQGEAFFEVRKAAGKPFTVFGPRSKTQVLGTSFNVRAIAGNETESVAVLTGKVSFANRNNEQQQVILLPGHTGVLNAQNLVSKEVSKDSNLLAWKTGKLVFSNSSLKEVVQTLEQHFGVKIRVQDPAVLNCRFTGAFEQPDLKQILQVLSLTSNLDLQLQNQEYVLSGSGCF